MYLKFYECHLENQYNRKIILNLYKISYVIYTFGYKENTYIKRVQVMIFHCKFFMKFCKS